MSAAITMSLIVGWFLGFLAYWACRVGYKTFIQALEELEDEKTTKGRPSNSGE